MANNKTSSTIQALWVGLGSFAAFVMTMGTAMILSRYFSKEDYGTYRQVLYVYNTLLVIFTLGLPKAYSYFLPRVDDKYANDIVNKITKLFYLLGGIFSLLLFTLSTPISIVLNNPNLAYPLKIFSPVPFFLLPTMGIEGIFATYNKNKYMALYNIGSKTFILLCVALPIVLWSGNVINAIVGFVVASFLSYLAAHLLKLKILKNKGCDVTNISYKEILSFAFPLLSSSLWGLLFGFSLSFFISRFFGTEVFAEFSNGALELPFVGMIVTATSTVLLPMLSKMNHDEVDAKTLILPIWVRVFEKSIKLTYPLLIFFFFYAQDIMSILYGEKYIYSGVYFKIMLLSSFFTVIAYSPILIAIGSLKFFNKVHMLGALCAITLQYISILLFNSSYIVVFVYVFCNIGMIISMLLYLAKYFKMPLMKIIPLKLILKMLLIATAILYLTQPLIKYFIIESSLILKISITFIIYSVVYFFCAKIAKIDYSYISKLLLDKIKFSK